ncbi:MAG: cohesin domain-containing protein [Planctomycetota bacterium]|nr:cohesin domain-containing protein [Planctomycetota bacterium]
MTNVSGNNWSATIPGSAVQTPGVEYYVTATDGISQVYHGTPAAPHSVVVANTPTLLSVSPSEGGDDGGESVTLAGTLFQPGAGVLFGDMPASNVVVLSANQITCTTPSHFPAMVDVTMNNPDGSHCTLLNGFRFMAMDVVVSLPTVSADHGEVVEVPLSVSNVEGLGAADLTIVFDPGVAIAQSVRTGAFGAGWSLSPNTGTAGRVVLSMANATAVSGSGVLAYITFEAVGAPTTQTSLTIQSALLNDGAIQCDLSPGTFNVNGLFSVDGTITYVGSGEPVRSTEVSLVGVGVHTTATDEAGQFAIGDVQTGSYALMPRKDDDVTEITAYDASLVLRAASELLTLTPTQVLAADVNGNGRVTSMDAMYILQKAVGLLEVPFPGVGKAWLFMPEGRSYALLNSNQTSQDFTAILIGDVSGNWTPPIDPPLGMATPPQGGVRLTAPAATLSLPTVESSAQEQAVLPLLIDFTDAEIYSADLVLVYDPAVLSLQSITAGGAAEGMGYALIPPSPASSAPALRAPSRWLPAAR